MTSENHQTATDSGPDRPRFEELASQGDVKGVAVTHESFGTGECRSSGDGSTVLVEFGTAGRTECLPPHALSVDWAYYADNPDHATAPVAKHLEVDR